MLSWAEAHRSSLSMSSRSPAWSVWGGRLGVLEVNSSPQGQVLKLGETIPAPREESPLVENAEFNTCANVRGKRGVYSRRSDTPQTAWSPLRQGVRRPKRERD